MKSRATLDIRLSGTDERRSLGSVLAPDNEGAPRGLRLSMTGKRAAMEFRVESDSPASALSTVLALLRDVALFQEVWLLSHRRGGRVQRG